MEFGRGDLKFHDRVSGVALYDGPSAARASAEARRSIMWTFCWMSS